MPAVIKTLHYLLAMLLEYVCQIQTPEDETFIQNSHVTAGSHLTVSNNKAYFIASRYVYHKMFHEMNVNASNQLGPNCLLNSSMSIILEINISTLK